MPSGEHQAARMAAHKAAMIEKYGSWETYWTLYRREVRNRSAAKHREATAARQRERRAARPSRTHSDFRKTAPRNIWERVRALSGWNPRASSDLRRSDALGGAMAAHEEWIVTLDCEEDLW